MLWPQFLILLGGEAVLLPAVAWAGHEALADLGPVGLLGAYLVADGPIPGTATGINPPEGMDRPDTRELLLFLLQIWEVWLPFWDLQLLLGSPHSWAMELV